MGVVTKKQFIYRISYSARNDDGNIICKTSYVKVEHNCTIFLCSLDVKNIVQGGDPLLYMRVFFLHRALEAILDQNECVFCKKQLGCEPEKKK